MEECKDLTKTVIDIHCNEMAALTPVTTYTVTTPEIEIVTDPADESFVSVGDIFQCVHGDVRKGKKKKFELHLLYGCQGVSVLIGFYTFHVLI